MAENESHQFFPSGEWEGFYTYAYGPSAQRHQMSFFLNFQNGQVDGRGTDDVAAFRWRGQYDVGQLWCRLTKFYPTHSVEYDGQVDENGIWGKWTMDFGGSGGFHIWPKKQEANEENDALKSVKIKKEKKTSVAWI